MSCFYRVNFEVGGLENSPAGTFRHRDDDGRRQRTPPIPSPGNANRGANFLPCLCASPLQQRTV